MARRKAPPDLYEFERTVYAMNSFTWICGADEAGRGPLAGPVFAAAVILPRDFAIEGLNDSKKLSEKKRESLYGLITKEAVAYQICSVSEKEIDRLNILAASMLAIKKAVEGLSVRPDAAYIDGNRAPELEGDPSDTGGQGGCRIRVYRRSFYFGKGCPGSLYAGVGPPIPPIRFRPPQRLPHKGPL